MRILIITEIFPISDEEKYTPDAIKRLTKSWEKLGLEVRIIRPNFFIKTYLKKNYSPDGFYENVENINYILPFLGNIKKKIKTLFAPDIIIAHGLNGLIFANKLGCPFSAGIGTAELKILKNPFYRIYFKPQLEKALEKSHRIACNSFVVKANLDKLYPQFKKKTFVTPCGIDDTKITNRIWLEEEKEKIKVISCGEFVKENNFDKVIKACENNERIQLTIIGDNKEKLEKLSDKVIFTGYLPQKQIIEKLKESDIFILPSEIEDFGTIYLEAMASGCITIGLKNYGIDGILKDSINGFLGDNVEEILKKAIEFPDKNWILKNGYETVSMLTESRVALHYINCLAINTPKM